MQGVRTVPTLERQGGPCESGRPSGARQLRDARALDGEATADRAAALVASTVRIRSSCIRIM